MCKRCAERVFFSPWLPAQWRPCRSSAAASQPPDQTLLPQSQSPSLSSYLNTQGMSYFTPLHQSPSVTHRIVKWTPAYLVEVWLSCRCQSWWGHASPGSCGFCELGQHHLWDRSTIRPCNRTCCCDLTQCTNKMKHKSTSKQRLTTI